jgi:hypothetical protein
VGESNSGPAHVVDGALDANSTLIASNASLDLYADWDGEFLYVAAEGAGSTSGWDHFIILGTDLAPPVAAPWAKAGTVADRTLFLGNEDSNNWCGWFNASEAVITNGVESASGTYLEGTVHLATYLGSPLPAGVYLAGAAYASPDGGSLQRQAPAGNGNGSVDAAEYVYFPLATSGVGGGDSRDGEDGPDSDPATSPRTVSVTPNPFTATAYIQFILPLAGNVTVSIFDLQGRLVRTLTQGPRARGAHSLTWNGLDLAGHHVAPGIYFIYLESKGRVQAQKIVAIK